MVLFQKIKNMKNKKYFFDQDNDSHWYMIPLDKKGEWTQWNNDDDINKDHNKYNDYILNGYIDDISFENPQDIVLPIKNESIDPHGGLPLQLGPLTDFDMFCNKRVIGNILSSNPDEIKGFNTEYIKDKYFEEPNRLKKKKKKRKKLKKFKDI
jgi:hypothetical protein